MINLVECGVQCDVNAMGCEVQGGRGEHDVKEQDPTSNDAIATPANATISGNSHPSPGNPNVLSHTSIQCCLPVNLPLDNLSPRGSSFVSLGESSTVKQSLELRATEPPG